MMNYWEPNEKQSFLCGRVREISAYSSLAHDLKEQSSDTAKFQEQVDAIIKSVKQNAKQFSALDQIQA